MLHSAKLEKRNSERGSILAISALGMLTFLLAVGLCVDISHFYVVKAELQNAADAAALAGASALNSAPNGITEATNRAVQLMNNYEFNNQGVTIEPENVKFAVNFGGPYMDAASAQSQAENIRFVHVEIPPKPVGVFFATPVLNTNTVNLSQEAIAGMSVAPNVFCDWIPLSVIDDDVNTILPGNLYTIRAGPGNKVSPGNYQILAVDGKGGKEVREDLAGGVDNCLGAGEMVLTKPGVTAGPVRQGLNTRFGDYSGGGVNADDYPPDMNVKQGITWEQYRNATPASANWQSPNPSYRGVAMRRVVIIPIIKIGEFGNGRDEVRIDRFGAFFLREQVGGGNGGDIQAEYIGERFVFGKGGFKPDGGNATPQLAQPVLYK
jgi:Flp pilus assembly protein TadG